MHAPLDLLDPRIALEGCEDQAVRIWLDDHLDAWGLVSAIDAPWVLQHIWCAHVDQRGKHYVRRTAGARLAKRQIIYLHREIMLRVAPPPTPAHRYVDHINGQGRDNRRENLRWTTAAENARNIHGIEWRQPVLFEGRQL